MAINLILSVITVFFYLFSYAFSTILVNKSWSKMSKRVKGLKLLWFSLCNVFCLIARPDAMWFLLFLFYNWILDFMKHEIICSVIFLKYGNSIKSSKQFTDIIEYAFFCM